MELILNLRIFPSAKGLLGHVTKLRRSSGRIKPQSAWYLTRERESTQHLGCWSCRICSKGEEKPLRTLDLDKVQEGYPGSLSEFDNREKWNALRHKIMKEIYTVDHRKIT
jgi:hypothetical protein